MVWTSFFFTGWSAVLLVIGSGLAAWWRLGFREGFTIGIAGLVSLITDVFKIAVNRPRPSLDQVQIIGINHGNGYPSGHTFFATIILGILAYLLFTHLKNRGTRIVSLVVMIMLMLMVGTSRIYLGAHWPSDVFGGYILGGFFLTILIYGRRRLEQAANT